MVVFYIESVQQLQIFLLFYPIYHNTDHISHISVQRTVHSATNHELNRKIIDDVI